MDDDFSSSIVVLGDLLDRAADERPERPALTDGERSLSWSEYRSAADRLAVALASAGATPGDRVAIHLPKSVDSFVAVHAVLRLGGVVVPIDWFAPPAYASQVIADASPTAIVSSAAADVLAGLVGDEVAIVRPDDPTGHGAARPSDGIPAARTPDDDAYIVYTSGSTGRPKGIVHTHASAMAYAAAAAGTYALHPDDRLVNVAPLHFDQSTFELYAAPLAQAAVIVLSDVVLRFPASTAELVERERATVWYSVPHAIVQLTTRGAVADRDLSSLRWVLFGGESFPTGALAESMRALPSARFSNVYGPAEVNQCSCFHLDAPPGDDEPVPIGRAWPAARFRLVDEQGRPVAPGTPGELLVSTSTMMSRYWDRPDLTDAAIERDGGAESERWYRTGDLVVDPGDGEIVFVGRRDHQVKVRGHRIELEAVEAVICEHPSVDDAAVVVERGDGSDPGADADRLLALVVPDPDEATRRDIVAHLRDRLPRYAVPSGLVGATAVPRTPVGKIDRPAASELALAPNQRTSAQGAPTTG